MKLPAIEECVLYGLLGLSAVVIFLEVAEKFLWLKFLWSH